MFYDRNEGVKSILNARMLDDPVEKHWQTSALFNTVTGKITHNLTIDARDNDLSWLYITYDTCPIYTNNIFVGYWLGGDWCDPDEDE